MNLQWLIMAAAFILPAATAWPALEIWWPAKSSGNGERLLKLSLAGPLGAGFGSLWFFVWSMAFTPTGRAMIFVHMGVLVAVLAILLLLRIKRKRPIATGAPLTASSNVQNILGLPARLLCVLAGAVAAGLALAALVTRLLQNPHGGWDAWAIWNLRARFLYRSGPFWTDSFSPDLFWSSPDYPLGLPGIVALFWKYLGKETLVVPMLVATMFFVATGGLLYASLRRLNGQVAATLGLVVLAGTPFFIGHSASQYADVPLGFFFLGATVLMASYDYDPDKHRGWLVLAGIVASLAAWTKNEGMLFLIALVIARVTVAAVQGEWRRLSREGLAILTGAAPTLIVLFVFKSFFAPPNGFLSAQSWAVVWEKLTDGSRYQEIGTAFFKETSMYGDGMSILALPTLFLIGVNWRGFKHKSWLSGMLILAIMLTGYFFIYVITPSRLSWHLGTSLSRILLQLWPMTIFLVYLNLKPARSVISQTV